MQPDPENFSVLRLSEQDHCLCKYFHGTPLLNAGKKLEAKVEALSDDNSEDEFQIHAYLNTGHYSLVEDKYRTLFAYICSLVARFEFRRRNYFEALRKCDDGLLKSNDVADSFLVRFAEFICANFLPKCSALPSTSTVSLSSPPSVKRTVPISCRIRPSMEEFHAEFFAKSRPVIIRGMVEEWPAFEKWSFETFNERYGHRTVPVELGGRYTDEDWHTKMMTINEYFTEYVFSDELKKRRAGYLAQHRLIDQIPALSDDIFIPDYCGFASDGLVEEKLTLNVFVGPEGTVSPLHTDPRHNFFCQVVGRKFVRLIDPAFSDRLYLFDDIIHNNTSMVWLHFEVDVESPDLSQFPAFADVDCQDFLMEAGDCLFIPRRYFHFVKALDRSISVSIWFGEG